MMFTCSDIDDIMLSFHNMFDPFKQKLQFVGV